MTREVRFYSREVPANPFQYIGSLSMNEGDVSYERMALENFDVYGHEVMAMPSSRNGFVYAYTFAAYPA